MLAAPARSNAEPEFEARRELLAFIRLASMTGWVGMGGEPGRKTPPATTSAKQAPPIQRLARKHQSTSLVVLDARIDDGAEHVDGDVHEEKKSTIVRMQPCTTPPPGCRAR